MSGYAVINCRVMKTSVRTPGRTPLYRS